MKYDPFVSVVVPVYNSEKTILKTLDSLSSQTYKNFEVIIVDDGSTCPAGQMVKSYSFAKYFYQQNGGPAKARNVGAKLSKGEIICFTDSDCVPEEKWIQKLLDGFTNDDIAVVSGSYGIENKSKMLAQCIHNEILFRHNKLMPDYPKSFGSYNFAIRRKVFEEVGGFRESYRFASGEDNDLSYKIINSGFRIFFNKECFVRHHHTEIVSKYLIEQFRHGFWRMKLYLEHPKMARGDDYTFWKDIAEVPLSAIVSILFLINICSFFSYFIFAKLFYILLLAFGAMELFYSLMCNKSLCEIIFYVFVMFFRSFFRMFGFTTGFFCFLFAKRSKKV